MFGSVRFRFQKPETGKTPTEPNRFGLRGTINTKKNRVTFLNPSIHTPAPAVLLLAPEPLPQLTIHNSQFHICNEINPSASSNVSSHILLPPSSSFLSHHLHLQTPASHILLPPSSSSNASQPHPSPTGHHLHLKTSVSHVPLSHGHTRS